MSLVSTIHSHSQEIQPQRLSHAGTVPPQIKREIKLMIEVASADLKGVEQVKFFLLAMG